MIEKTLILNLEKRLDKWMFALGALRALHFNIGSDMIYRFLGHDGAAYESREAVMEAAVADGFDYFKNYDWMTDKRAIAWSWSWASVMREIININKTVLFLQDDISPMPGWSYLRFCKLVQDADHFGEVKIIQLNASLTPNLERVVLDPMLARGIGGPCDFGFILRPKGAQLFLDAQKIPIADQGASWDFPCVDVRRVGEQRYEFDCITGVYHTLSPAVAPEQIKFNSDLGNDYS